MSVAVHPRPSLSATAAPWPMAGTPAFERLDPGWRSRLADRLERDLRRHVVDPWYPRCIDPDGGYLCDFDRAWRPHGPQLRSLEFQARQLRTAARLGVAYPEERRWVDITRHGVRYLREVMRDPREGGWFWLVDRTGMPRNGGTKHAHGVAYLIDAAVEAYRLTGDADALAMACDGFDWLEAHVHDREHGGWFGWTTREGRPIRTAADVPDPAVREPIGDPIGVKDANVHADLLEAFTLLQAVAPDPRVADRLAEVRDLLVGPFATAGGAMHYMLEADLRPVPALQRFGYPLQAALRLVLAADVLGEAPHAAGLVHARRFVAHGVRHGWHARGGFVMAGPGAMPDVLGRRAVVVPDRMWWVQTEGLKALLLFAAHDGDGSTAQRLAERMVDLIDRRFLDRRWGGWFMAADDERTLRERVRRPRMKGDMWKDASHEADMYLVGARIVRGLAPEAPLGERPSA